MNGTRQDTRGLQGLKKKRRIQVMALAFVSVFVAVGVIYFFVPASAINFFRSPTEVASNPPPADQVFRLGGLVEKGSVVRGEGTTVSFMVTDTNKSVKVEYVGVLPDLFAEGQGMIALGQMKDGVFIASEILAKHDETYQPKEVVEALKKQGVELDPSIKHGS